MRATKIIFSSLAVSSLMGLAGCLTSADSAAGQSAALARRAAADSVTVDSLRRACPPKPARGDSLGATSLSARVLPDSLRPAHPPRPALPDSLRPPKPVRPDSLRPPKPAHPPVKPPRGK